MASSPSLTAATAAVVNLSFASLAFHRRRVRVSSFPSKRKKPLLPPVEGLGSFWDRSAITKSRLNEVVGGSSNDAAPAEPEAGAPASKGKEAKSGDLHSQAVPLSEEEISEFMNQAASLVKLVDSKDIAELQLKQPEFELIIRKKEALPPVPSPIGVMHPPSAPMAMPSPVSPPPATAALPSSAAAGSSGPSPSPATSSAPKVPKSSHPSLKSPMAGTFYRSPGPGLPPFVKPGDKVNKGQVLCIIEAMKLMNEIEAEKAGTVVEILVDDGKPVGIDQPLFIIEP